MMSPRVLPDFSRLSLGALKGTDLDAYGVSPEVEDAAFHYLEGSPEQIRTRFNLLLDTVEEQSVKIRTKLFEVVNAQAADPSYRITDNERGFFQGLQFAMQSLKAITERMDAKIQDKMPGTGSDTQSFARLTNRFVHVKLHIDTNLDLLTVVGV